MTYKNDIENLFKENFEDYTVNPSKTLWNKINKKLMIKDFFRFNPGKLNIYYTVLAIGITSVLAFSLNSNNKSSNQDRIQKNELNVSKENNSEMQSLSSVINKELTDINNEISEDITAYKENSNVNTNSDNNKKLHKTISNQTDDITKEEVNNERINNVKLAKPLAKFSASKYSACEPAVIEFKNSSENCSNYLWEFENGKTSTLSNPTFVFRTAGKYTVKLTVTSGSVSNTTTQKIVINKKPKADFVIKKTEDLFVNDEILFNNISSNYSKSIWDFGDGNKSNFSNPTHSYETSGKYAISLICYSDKNCSDTVEMDPILIQDEKYKISVPTAFSPDKNGAVNGYWKANDYSNNIFYPIINNDVSEYNLKVYNKFGTLIFESKDINYGWNGYFNDQPLKSDVYIWKLSGKFSDGDYFNKTGNVTLLYLRN